MLDGAAALLLDFDGPICDTFHGYPPSLVTAELVATVRADGVGVPEQATRLGPHAFLVWVGETYPELVATVEHVLTVAERQAVTSAPPTPYAMQLIRTAAASGLRLGIVSNNAGSAIERYLALHAITAIQVVRGRPEHAWRKMKPDPWPLREAARRLGVEVGGSVLLGDSDTDVLAGRAAGVPVIGYAPAPARAAELTRAGADLVVPDLRDLLPAVDT